MTEPTPTPDPYRGSRRFAQAFAAVAAVIFAVVVMNVWTTRRINAVQEEVRGQYRQQLMQKDATIMLMQSVMERDGDMKQVLERAKFKVVELTSNDGKASGRILIDAEGKAWYLFAAGLPPLPEGKVYELWYVMPDQKKVAAGTFNTDASNAGRLKVTPPTDVAGVAVTDDLGATRLAGKPASP